MASGIFGYTCLGISISLACPLSCAHCITGSGPRVQNEMSVAEALKYIRDAAGAVNHISFTGGESFLNLRKLEILIREAKKQDFIVSVMTSGFWARTPARTLKILTLLKENGLDMIGVSLDRFHLEYLNEYNSINIAEAGEELGLQVAIRVIIQAEDNYGKQVERLLKHTQAKVHVNYLVCLGRATNLPESDFKFSKKPPREICETVTAVEIVPGGNVYACCGPGQYMIDSNPLFLGNAQTDNLYDILERGLKNSFMKVINTRGPYGLLEDIREYGYGDVIKIRSIYKDACQLCLDICNSPGAVKTLKKIYQNEEIKRKQNATQFLKMTGELTNTLKISAQIISEKKKFLSTSENFIYEIDHLQDPI